MKEISGANRETKGGSLDKRREQEIPFYHTQWQGGSTGGRGERGDIWEQDKVTEQGKEEYTQNMGLYVEDKIIVSMYFIDDSIVLD